LVVGDGRNEVSVTYVDNAAAAHVQAAAQLRPGAALSGKAYFVADAAPVALWPWLVRLLNAVGLPGPKRRLPLWLARALGACAEAVWAALALDGEPPLTRFVASQLARSHSYSLEPAGEPPLTRFVASQLARSHSYSLEPARAAFGYAVAVSAEDAFARTVGFWKERLTRGAGPR
jgi:nucleoside-diphosphate-sugar epimerase